MSIKHQERIERIVDKALKEAAMGEPYGYAVEFCFAPAMVNTPEGPKPIGDPTPCWFIIVTIRAGLTEPDVGNGFPVFGILPSDEDFRVVARALLERCRQDRHEGNAKVLQAFGPSMKLSERPT